MRYTVGLAVRGDFVEKYSQLLKSKGFSKHVLKSTIVVKNELAFKTRLSHYLKSPYYRTMMKLISKLKIQPQQIGGAFEVYDNCAFGLGGKTVMCIAIKENYEDYFFSKFKQGL